MRILGIKCSGHDTGAAVVSDRSGTLEINAISEARLNRRKHSYAYPLLSIKYVMESAGIESLDDFDLICIDCHGELWPESDSQFGRLSAMAGNAANYDFDPCFNYLIEQSIRFPPDRVRYINHVDAHAASSYYVSGFDESAILTIEGGMGLYVGRGTSIAVRERSGYGGDEYRNGVITASNTTAWPRHRYNISNLYDVITRKLGLDKFAAGKTMALAAFRDRVPVRNILNIPADRHRGFMSDYREIVRRFEAEVEQFTPVSADAVDVELLAEYWVNIAREAQDALEEDVLYFARLAAEASGSKNLCLAGGVALSCVTNRKILDLGAFDRVYVQPAASDEGIPLGCALWGYYQVAGGVVRTRMDSAYLGRPNRPEELPAILSRWSLDYKPADAAAVAAVLAAGGIIGRVAGASEYGPRALGNRSILADPRIGNMLEVVNTQIKHRERFRPFAPSCLEEKQALYFDLPCPSPFMLMACQVLPEAKSVIPAVVHVDGTSRVQTVRPDQNQGYFDLLNEFGKATGVFVLLNTSFNDNGEPIVENYDDAILSFVRTGLHALYVDGLLVSRPDAGKCEEIRRRLADSIRGRVDAEYAAAIAELCDASRHATAQRSLSQPGAGVLAARWRRYLRKARAYEPRRFGPGCSFGSLRRAICALGDVARYGQFAPTRIAATLAMLAIYSATQLRQR